MTPGRYAALMLDEFHERSWELDLLVALARRRPGPKLILCSATLAVDALVEALGGHELRSEGRSFPVSIEHAGEDAPSERELEARVAAAVEGACADAGDVLVIDSGLVRASPPRRPLDPGAVDHRPRQHGSARGPGRYRCRVRFEPRRVTLEPLDARARKRGEPKRELLPRFRGFAVVYRQASRRVVLRE